MAEQSPDFSPFNVGRSLNSSDAPLAQRDNQPRTVAQEWERILWTKTAPMLSRPVEEARPFGRRERTPAPVKWLRLWWARRWSRRKGERLQHNIHETGANLQNFMVMAQYAINLAVQSEPLVEVQTAKRRELMNRWRNTYERVFSRSVKF